MNPKTKLRFFHETIEDLRFNPVAESYFLSLKKLIESDFELCFYRSGDDFSEPTTIIKDIGHLNNFVRNYRFDFSVL